MSQLGGSTALDDQPQEVDNCMRQHEGVMADGHSSAWIIELRGGGGGLLSTQPGQVKSSQVHDLTGRGAASGIGAD